MTTSLSFNSECQYCQTETSFSALSIPTGLPEKQIQSILKEREVDCCYTCYTLHEQGQQKKLDLLKS